MCNAAYDLNYDITLISSSDKKLKEFKTEIKILWRFRFKLLVLIIIFLTKEMN